MAHNGTFLRCNLRTRPIGRATSGPRVCGGVHPGGSVRAAGWWSGPGKGCARMSR